MINIKSISVPIQQVWFVERVQGDEDSSWSTTYMYVLTEEGRLFYCCPDYEKPKWDEVELEDLPKE